MNLEPVTGADAVLTWRKSSYSSNDGPDCVETAIGCHHVHVRDSKKTDSATLAFTPAAWTDFVSYAAAG